jgi:hypothetical protein
MTFFTSRASWAQREFVFGFCSHPSPEVRYAPDREMMKKGDECRAEIETVMTQAERVASSRPGLQRKFYLAGWLVENAACA